MAIPFLLINLLDLQSDQSCSSYTCKTSSQTFSSDTCIFYDPPSDKYYTSPCPSSFTCNISSSSNSTCLQSPEYTYSRYPGEKCNIPQDCLLSLSLGCINNRCIGGSLSAPCASSSVCNPGLRCHNSTCTAQLQVGLVGCLSDSDCVNFAGCLLGTCTVYFSIPTYGPVAECNNFKSAFCSSGMCQGDYCVDAQRTSGGVPKKCKDDSDCFTSQGLGGQCSCGLNGKATQYCSLFTGDSDYASYLQLMQEWHGTYMILQCNTLRRFSAQCMGDYWDRPSAVAYGYYLARTMMFPLVSNFETCVGEVYLTEYLASKKAYDSVFDGGVYMGVVGFVVIVI